MAQLHTGVRLDCEFTPQEIYEMKRNFYEMFIGGTIPGEYKHSDLDINAAINYLNNIL